MAENMHVHSVGELEVTACS